MHRLLVTLDGTLVILHRLSTAINFTSVLFVFGQVPSERVLMLQPCDANGSPTHLNEGPSEAHW